MTLTLTLTLTLTNYKIEYIIWDRYNLNLKVIGPDMGQTLGFHRCYGPAIGPAILSNLANQNL